MDGINRNSNKNSDMINSNNNVDNKSGNNDDDDDDDLLILPNINPFSMSLFNVINAASSEGANVFISPYSIALSLGMALAGATPSSKCEIELENALGVSSKESLSQLFSTVQLQVQQTSSSSLRQSSALSDGADLTTSNSIWIEHGISKEYVSFVSNRFAAHVDSLPKNYDPINEKIQQQTNGLITNVFPGGQTPIDPLTVAILVNAIYFKGLWDIQFEKDQSSDGLFTTMETTTGTVATNTKPVKFMRALRNIEVATNVEYLDGASVIKLDYKGKQFSALFFLPREEEEEGQSSMIMKSMIDALVKYDSNANFSDSNTQKPLLFDRLITNDLLQKRVNLMLPRFRAEFGTESLKPQLKQLGITKAFGDDADEGRNPFSLMVNSNNDYNDNSNIYIEDIFHKAIIEVTEEGTVASASTAAVMMTRSLPPPPVQMVFDRPFCMVILHLPTKTPIFIGKIEDPTN